MGGHKSRHEHTEFEEGQDRIQEVNMMSERRRLKSRDGKKQPVEDASEGEVERAQITNGPCSRAKW